MSKETAFVLTGNRPTVVVAPLWAGSWLVSLPTSFFLLYLEDQALPHHPPGVDPAVPDTKAS